MKETISCGRPGSEMPSFLRGAWTTTKCFGMTGAEAGADKPQADAQLNEIQIDALLDYLFAKVVKQGPATKAVCEEYFAPGSPRCANL